MRKIYSGIIFKPLLFILLVAISISKDYAQIIAPDFTITSSGGSSYNLYQELDAGKIVVLGFFTISCGTCASGVPFIEQVWQNAGANGAYLWVWGIESYYGTNAEIDSFISVNGGTYPGFSSSGNESLLALYEITYTPRYFVIYPNHTMKIVTVDNIQETVNEGLYNSPVPVNRVSNTSRLLGIEPGNPITINYYSRNNCNVSFEIFDVLGNLKNRYSTYATRGIHTISASYQKLNRGYYFIRMLENNNPVDQKKFTIN